MIMPNTHASQSRSTAGHRIGAVSALSGVPVPTLRGWEIRYGTFSPRMTEGRQRLYNDDDVLRATLLRRLTEQGHSISGIANHDAAKLSALLHHHDASQRRNAPHSAEREVPSVAVVGLALAARLASNKFRQIFSGNGLQVTDVFPDLDAALVQPLQTKPEFLLVRTHSLHSVVQAQLHRLIDRSSVQQVIVLYHFGQEKVVESMKRAGMVVRREPVSDYELAELFRSSLLMDAPQAMAHTGLGATIPPRKYDDATLARMHRTGVRVQSPIQRDPQQRWHQGSYQGDQRQLAPDTPFQAARRAPGAFQFFQPMHSTSCSASPSCSASI